MAREFNLEVRLKSGGTCGFVASKALVETDFKRMCKELSLGRPIACLDGKDFGWIVPAREVASIEWRAVNPEREAAS